MRSSIISGADRAHAEYSAARGRMLRAVGELLSSGAWRGDGAGNLPAWLCARWQISYPVARELVREAEELRGRGALAASLESGAINAEQCKALEVLSEEGDDEVWLESLWSWSLPELQRDARKKLARELDRRDDGVYLRMRHTADERYLRGDFQLHPEDGAALIAAIDARIPAGTPLRGWDHAGALALVELAKGTTAPSTVVLNVNERALASGGFVGDKTASRLLCDARMQEVVMDKSAVVGIGRTARTVPPWLRRVVHDRDRGACTFPGCGMTHYLECHHVVPWSQGGVTDISNLLTMCWRHHALLHEGRWSVRGALGPAVTWIRPDGSVFEPRVRVVLDTS